MELSEIEIDIRSRDNKYQGQYYCDKSRAVIDCLLESLNGTWNYQDAGGYLLLGITASLRYLKYLRKGKQFI